MLIDEIEITLKGGNGAPGKVSFGKMEGSGPDGGNGGDGGDLYIRAISDLKALNQFSKQSTKAAGNGLPGAQRQKDGKQGGDLTVNLPVGTTLVDHATGQELELDEIGKTILICRGGIGGLGNYELRSARNTTPKKAQGGRPGEERQFLAILKYIADFGLIGLPNSGKSSLLNELTSATAEVGDYPFTTLEPNSGMAEGKARLDSPTSRPRRIFADIPGLIEGASHGRGLGVRFLKHIEKVKLLLHCIVADSEDIKKDYQIVRGELKEFGRGLTEKEEIVLLTKSDLAEKTQMQKQMRILKKLNKNVYSEANEVYPVSIHDWESLEALKKRLL